MLRPSLKQHGEKKNLDIQKQNEPLQYQCNIAKWLELVPSNPRVPGLNPAQELLQRIIDFDIILVINDHKPSISIAYKPLIGPGCGALYYACTAWVKPLFHG